MHVILALLLLIAGLLPAQAQQALVVTTCGTLPQAYAVGSTQQVTVDVNGMLCSSALSASTAQKYVVGNWYLPETAGFGSAGGVLATAGIIMCSYEEVVTPVTIDRLGITVTTVGTTFIQLAVYKQDLTTARPGVLIASTGNISNTGAIAVNAVTSPLTFQVGYGTANGKDLWFCLNKNDTTGIYASKSSSNSVGPARIGSATQGVVTHATIDLQGVTCLGAACTGGVSTFGTWPVTLAGSTWTDGGQNQSPRIGFRVLTSP